MGTKYNGDPRKKVTILPGYSTDRNKQLQIIAKIP